MKLIKIRTEYKNEKGETMKGWHIAVLLDSGRYVQIKSAFYDDRKLLLMLCEEYEESKK